MYFEVCWFQYENTHISQWGSCYIGFCSERNGDPQKRWTHPNPRDLGKLPTVAKDVIEVKGFEKRSLSWIISVSPKSNHKHLGSRCKCEASAAPQAKGCLETPDAGKARNRFSCEASGQSMTLPDILTPNFQYLEQDDKLLSLWTTQVAVICYRGPRKLNAASQHHNQRLVYRTKKRSLLIR